MPFPRAYWSAQGKLFKPDLVLQNKRIKLITIQPSHLEGLMQYSLDPKIWHSPAFTRNTTPESFTSYFEKALSRFANKTQHPFVIQDQNTKELIGSTRFYNIDEEVFNCTILSYSYVIPKHQRDGTNRNAKFLLLRYVFEELRAQRLEFHINATNTQSRKNVEGFGCTLEGIHRSDQWIPDVRFQGESNFERRNTCVYSIIQNEWPGIKSTVFKGFEEQDM